MSDPLNHLGSIWYQSEPSDFPYSPTKFLGWDFFATSYSKTALVIEKTFSNLRLKAKNFGKKMRSLEKFTQSVKAEISF